MGFLDSDWLITNGMVVYPENIDHAWLISLCMRLYTTGIYRLQR